MRYSDLTITTQDMTDLQWTESSATPGSAGSYLKSTAGFGTSAIYYKASTFDSANGFFGHECVNEVIASRLMRVLGVPHVNYSLIHACIHVDGKDHVTWINSSKSYRHTNESKQSFAHFFAQYRQGDETSLDLCDRKGWGHFVRQMLLVDYLIVNQDRHGANIEVLYLQDGRKRLAPVFDSGNSLVFSCYDVEAAIRSFDPLVDAVGTNFIGSKRLADNLSYIPQDIVNPLHESDRETILCGLDKVLPDYHLEKIWDIIWKRWCVYANV